RTARAGVALPAAIGLLVAAAVLAAVVAASPSAWMLLGAGRGLVPESAYPAWAFVLLLAATLGQLAGWAAAAMLVLHVLARIGVPTTWTTVRAVVTAVYLGLAGVPFALFHLLFGGWLLGMPRAGLDTWLAANHPDASWLLVTAHPIVDLSLVPLTAAFLGLFWGWGHGVRDGLVGRTLAALVLALTSLAIALSLGIHATLVHVRLS
ncbi:MAG TPA: hypothetical protein VNN07_12790, partial [Candidatus Tectomicrobia bacterium]|nr:hypothetical protein [Candidatus Tectomicrobia bacterium]